ncbi:MAG: hypothetical protein MJ076_02990 [Clostridia bacterium]|nr:hypothetical protein [Clostridia bacterium]
MLKMHLLDIHSHILPAVDDGARDIKTSIELLKMMKNQGITDVIATPHFDASVHNIDDFHSVVASAKEELDREKTGLDLPDVLIGSEVFYFRGIGKSYGIKSLSLANSNYLLLELQNVPIDDFVIKDINGLVYDLGLTPIFAHIERYAGEKGFKKILDLISYGVCYAQVNAASVIEPPFKRTAYKLIKKGYVSFIATDSHSPLQRPPMMDKALEEIDKTFDRRTVNMFVENSEELYNKITNSEKNSGTVI